MDENLSFDLAGADPAKNTGGERERHLVQTMSAAARETATAGETRAIAPWWKRKRTVLSVSIAGVLALTGGAALIPLSLWVNGTQVDPDLRIPINYTTDTGVEVSCEYWIYYGEPGLRDADDVRLIKFLNSHDWTGIGERAYGEAIADPFDSEEAGWLQNDTPEARDFISLNRGIYRALNAEIPPDLRAAAQQGEGDISNVNTMDCKGKLH